MPDASAPPFSYHGCRAAPAGDTDCMRPSKPSPVSTVAEADAGAGAGAAPEDSAHAVYLKYSRLQKKLQLEFDRELAEAVGLQRKQECCQKKMHHSRTALDEVHNHVFPAAGANAHSDAGTTLPDDSGDISAASDSDGQGDCTDDVMRHPQRGQRPIPALSDGSVPIVVSDNAAAPPANSSAAANGSTAANGSANGKASNNVNDNSDKPLARPDEVGTSLSRAPPASAAEEDVGPEQALGAHAERRVSVACDVRTQKLAGKGPETDSNRQPPAAGAARVKNVASATRAPPPKPRVRASKLEFKRLDHLYNKSLHDFYLVESSRTASEKDDKWEEFVFVVRRRFDWQNKYQNTVLDIKSPEIVAVLRQVLKDVKPVTLHEEKPSVDPSLLFNYRQDIRKILEKEESLLPEESRNKARIEHLTLVNEYICADYDPVVRRLEPLLEHGEITFDLLWALFLPNTLCYTKCGGSNEPVCLKLDWGSEKFHPQKGKWFNMECHFVDYDGRNFGECKATAEIPEFEGTCRIECLPIFPLERHPDVASLTQKLIARGRKFGTLTGMQYKYYKGLAFFKKENKLLRITVQSRIMVDSLTFRRMNPNYSPNPVSPGAGKSRGDADDDSIDLAFQDDTMSMNDSISNGGPTAGSGDLFSFVPQRLADRLVRLRAGGAAPKTPPRSPLTPELMSEEQLLMCSPTVLGFSFGDKMWAEFAVDSIHEIIFNTGAFDSLVLPESQKSIVRALVENHSGKGKSEKKQPGIDDIIKGKGRGLVAVLHGRPGVGKTLTAEGISEYLRKPLYMVSAGELGTDSRMLEHQLTKILEICYGWGAVLLLDEADVFLERRSVHELQRNALVSIFLRQLEYFQGIMFLTTNRVETFDEAFQSRIHIALKYNDLDRKAKRIIWGTFLDMVAREEITLAADRNEADNSRDGVVVGGGGEEAGDGKGGEKDVQLRRIVSKIELDELARHELNGRQIKNVVRTAQALARSMDEPLSLKHLTRVLEVTQEFEHDLKGTGQLEGMMSYA